MAQDSIDVNFKDKAHHQSHISTSKNSAAQNQLVLIAKLGGQNHSIYTCAKKRDHATPLIKQLNSTGSTSGIESCIKLWLRSKNA